MRSVIVVGGGVFGVTTALALRARGDAVRLLDPGPLPHALAESTDVSKIVRLDYGADETYVEMAERALEGWRAWNDRWRPERPLFHETGVVFLARAPMQPGSFERESFELLRRRGHALERLDARAISARFPAWNARIYVDGYFNPQGGWAESGAVVARLLDEARRAGVEVRGDTECARVMERGDRVVGVQTAAGESIESDVVVVANGAWAPSLLPWLASSFRTVGQPVVLFAPDDRAPFESSRFPVFAADIARTGFYGFPVNADGLVKIANHGPGRPMHPSSKERVVTREEESSVRAFVDETFPSLRDARVATTRVCVYCDTFDEHFWIAADPERRGLVVATGGSGHAFKFAPVLGALVADAIDGRVVPRFRWRPELRDARGEEAARHRLGC